MSGYKRVNFYELCRLCATNQQKEKTHIFQEEGRKIQLQNKIQSCLSLKVCENDFLPKVVCSQCLRTLEECSTFRKECYTSETMLSSYFNNFRYTEDFKKSGKVYIKDTAAKVVAIPTSTTTDLCKQTPASTSTSNVEENTICTTVNILQNLNNQEFYTLQLPTPLVPQHQHHDNKLGKEPPKIISQPQFVYNLNTIKTIASNPTKNMGENVAVNSNGEIFTVAPLIELDTLLAQNVAASKPQYQKKYFRKTKALNCDESKIVKIDLTHPEIDSKHEGINYDRLTKVPTQNKVSYSVKIEEAPKTTTTTALDSNCTNRINLVQNSNLSTIRNISAINNMAKAFNAANVSLSVSNCDPMTNYSTANLSTVTLPTPNFNTVPFSLNTKPEPTLQHVDYSVSDTLSNIFNVTTTTPTIKTLNQTNHQNLNFATNLNTDGFTTAPPPVNQTPTNLVPLEAPTKQSNESKRHSCDICFKTFRRREHLYQHLKLHTGFRPFKCVNCNKCFMRKEHLLRHMTSHSGQKNFTCNICDKSFSRNDNLLKHKKIHNKQNSFTCEICHKQFVMEHYYLAHMHTHDGDKCSTNSMWGLLKAV